ncbi:hypothetical protein MLD38_034093 [Melastoma candidum]|uniref:Uncharacterized protein n=1 Tax=Melastoma candidum TaxID=119954 RepID=A0ACB9M8Z4_9MYRT|nr:hypothetical protein MLD38_034093 [Melastoma candidum]
MERIAAVRCSLARWKRQRGIEFERRQPDGSEVQSALAQWTGQRTVPNGFIGGNHIGGCDKATAMHKEGKLVPLLTEAGAIAKVA